MKEFIFTEDQLKDLTKIGEKMLGDEQDPRSVHYVRKLNRPKISWFRIILCILIPAILLTGAVILLECLGVPTPITLISAVAALTVYIILMMKRAAICAVRIYQRYAPDSLRNKCRFEPSCSEYMLQAIEKYGLIRGVRKGICRLKRCNVNDGGFDYP